MRCVVSCGSTSFQWLVFFFGALPWGSMIHKHTVRWMWKGSALVVSWNWEKWSCRSKLVSTLSVMLSSVLSWRVSHAWNHRQIELSPGTWNLWLSKACVRLLWSLCWCRWCCHQFGLFGTDLRDAELICLFFFISCWAIDVISKAEIGDCSASSAGSAFVIF